jgi:Mrp family chromosome partitioning ATPase
MARSLARGAGVVSERNHPESESAPESEAVAAVRGGRLAEHYRALRAIVESAGSTTPAGAAETESLIVLVVGVEHGVSDVGIRLAAAFADGGRSTFLVDADLRAGSRHRLLRPGGHAPFGFADWLTSEASEPPLPGYPSGLPNLTVLPAGTSGPWRDDPLASDRLPKLVQAVRAARERAVVIAPPLGEAADALFLAPHADGTLLVVVPGKTAGPTALKARDTLLATGARLYGVVLGEAEPR